MSARTRQIVVAMLVLGLVITCIIVAYSILSHPSAKPQTSPRAPYQVHMQSCGNTKLDTVILGRAGSHHIIHVATFYPWGCPSKDAGCSYSGQPRIYPDLRCSPGAIYDLTGNTDPAKYSETANTTAICASTTDGRRRVRDSLKSDVFTEYGVSHHTGSSFEVDHIISLTLGGANDKANLYPEPALPKPGFHQKDIVEATLGRAICSGTVKLSQAQDIITHSWLAYYQSLRPTTAPSNPVQ